MAKKSKIPGMGIEEPGLMGEIKVDNFSVGDSYGDGYGDGYGNFPGMGGKKGKKKASSKSSDSAKTPAKKPDPPKVANPTLNVFISAQKSKGIQYKSPAEAEKAYAQKYGKNIDPKTGKPKKP